MSGRKIEAEPKSLHGGVYYGDRRNQQILEGKGTLDEMRVGPDIIAGGVGHCPWVHALKISHCVRTCVKWQGVFTVPAEGSQFIKACNMIEVGMSVENGINFAQAFTERLLAKVRTTIYQDGSFGRLQVERGPGSLISRVARSTNWARTSNDRDPY